MTRFLFRFRLALLFPLFFAFSLVFSQVASEPGYLHQSAFINFSSLNQLTTSAVTSINRGLDGYFAVSMSSTIGLQHYNYVFDSTLQSGFFFQPNTSNAPQYTVIDANHIVWYATSNNQAIHFTRMTEQGSILSQFKMQGYTVAGLYTDKLGRVFCVYYDNNGFGLMRFSSGGVPDFQKYVTVGFGGAWTYDKQHFAIDQRFYVSAGNGLVYVLDTNGDVVKTIAGSPTSITAYKDHSLAIADASNTLLRINKFDSSGAFVWGTQFRGGRFAIIDTLVENVNAVAIPGTDELFVTYQTAESYGLFTNSCNLSGSERINGACMLDGNGSLYGRKGIVINYYPLIGQYDKISITPYGAPMVIFETEYCFFSAYGAFDPRGQMFTSADFSPMCANVGSAVQTSTGPNYTLTMGSALSAVQTIPMLLDTFQLLFSNPPISNQLICRKPCAQIQSSQALGGGQVQFQEVMVGFHSFQYAFGDGTFGTSIDPLHTYSSGGSQTVTLIATNECGSDTSTILVNPCLSAGISGPSNACVGTPVTFTQSTSYLADSLEWLVNGVSSNTGASLVYNPTMAGTFQIGLVYHDFPCSDTVFQSLNVAASLPLPAFSFTFAAGNTLNFTNLSNNAQSYFWDFGDGTTSTVFQPNHSYAGNGPYTICLTATNPCGTDDSCLTMPCGFPSANFSAVASGGTVTIVDSSTNATNLSWNFGDGNTASGPVSSHTYTNSGTYTICQYASSACAIDTFCITVSVIANGSGYWRIVYNQLGVAEPSGQATDLHGNTMVVGTSASGAFMLLVDSTGTVQWTKTLPTTSYVLNDVTVMANGNFLVVGGQSTAGASQMDFCWMEVNLTGTISNANKIISGGYDVADVVRPARYGGYLLTGFGGNSNGQAGGIYVKLDNNLQVVWKNASSFDVFAAFQAADSSHWLVQRDRFSPGTLQFVKLNQAGAVVLNYNLFISNNLGVSPQNRNIVADMDCNGNIVVLTSNPEFHAWNSTSPFMVGLYKFNVSSLTGSGSSFGYQTSIGSNYDYDVFPTDVIFKKDGNLQGSGYIHPRGNANTSSRKEQVLWNINATTLSTSVFFSGNGATQDTYDALSNSPSGAVIVAGAVNGSLQLRKFLTNANCNTGFSIYGLSANTSSTTFSASLGAFGGSVSVLPVATPLVVSPTPLPGTGTIACLSPCSTAVNAAFTSSINGSNMTLTSNSTPGAVLTWNVTGQACLTGNSVTFPIGCGNVTASLTASNGCAASTFSQSFSFPGTISNPASMPSLLPDTTICSGGALTLSAPAGYASYLWGNGSTGTSVTLTTAGTMTLLVGSANGCYSTDTSIITTAAPPTASIGPNQTVCAGQSVTFSVGLGFASYLWSNGSTGSSITVTAPGTYSVTVTNGSGCTGTASAVLNNFSAPSPSISPGPNQMVCAGQSVTFTASAGYNSYLWSNGSSNSFITVSIPGTYTVTVTDANGCTGIGSVSLSNFAPASVSVGPNQSICIGSSTTLSATAGFANYNWSNGATTSSTVVSTPGTYAVTVTDGNGCTASSSMVLSNFPVTSISLGNDTVIVAGTSLVLNAGSGFSNYLWNTSATTSTITVNTAGVYWVQANDANGCLVSDTIEIFLVPQPNINVGYNGMTINVAGTPNGMATYTWTFGNGATASGQNASYTYTIPGTYQVCLTITTAQGLSTTTCTTVTVPGPLGITNVAAYQLEVSPNPASDRLHVKLRQGQNDCIEFSLWNGIGQKVWSKTAECQTDFDFVIDLEQLTSGVYFLRVIGAEIIDIRKVEVLR